MKVRNIHNTRQWFQVLQTHRNSQTALMTLAPGHTSSDQPESHSQSEQVLLVLRGSLAAEVGTDRGTLHEGDVIIIAAGIKHRFSNPTEREAVTFNVYSPPEYPSDESA
jgi:mannose-6-phosphate isomerase-like protein (cupin superfamily)